MDLLQEEAELRAAVADLSSVKERRRYDEPLRQRLVTHVQARRARGESLSRIAGSLGIPAATLERFGARPAFVRLGIREELTDASHGLRVRAPGGFVVEGLTFEQVGELLARFSCSA